MSRSESSIAPVPTNANLDADPALEWPALPTETEIYILPTGEVIVADLPAELAALVAQLALKQHTLT